MLLERKSDRGIQMAFEERDMFCLFDSPFIVALNYAFQTTHKLCFVLDYMNGMLSLYRILFLAQHSSLSPLSFYQSLCPGGDLEFHRQQQPKRRFTEKAARFYAAEIALGLEHIHSKHVVYRDLKVMGNLFAV